MVEFTSRLLMDEFIPKLLACLPSLNIKAPSDQHQLLAAVLLFMTSARKMLCHLQVCHLALESLHHHSTVLVVCSTLLQILLYG